MNSMVRRQRIRRTLLWVMFLSFPIVQMYLSPATLFFGAKSGILTGSVIVFGIFFLSALFFGRAYCGWLCPVAGFQEACADISNKPVPTLKFDFIKYLVWGAVIVLFAVFAIKGGGIKTVDPFFSTTRGISMDKPGKLFVYYRVLVPIFLMSVFIGRRSFCHHLCWMAPFLVVGRTIRNVFNWSSLQLKKQELPCPSDCTSCNQFCTMSLDVRQMATSGKIEHPECVQCGNCVDYCPEGILIFAFGRLSHSESEKPQSNASKERGDEKSSPIKKSLLKRITSISLALTGLFTLNTGVWNFFPPFVDSFSPGHAIGACIFCALGLFHIWLNWKPLAKYFKNLGWWWVPIGLGVISIILVTGIPVIRLAIRA